MSIDHRVPHNERLLWERVRPFRSYWLRIRGQSRELFYDTLVKGSYTTGNIGDLAIGHAIQSQLESRHYNTRLVQLDRNNSNSRIRIVGGGGVLHDWQGYDSLAARLNYVGNGDCIIAVGAPGVQTDMAKELINQTLDHLDLVTVRDKRSQNILQEINKTDTKIHLTACPAWCHTPPQKDSKSRTGVNFRPWFDLPAEALSDYFGYQEALNTEQANQQYIKNARQICDSVENPVFIPFKKKDEMFARKHLDIDVLNYRYSVRDTFYRVSQVKRMVCMRYHSFVFASLCKIPVLPIAYAPKVNSLADRLNVDSYQPHSDIRIKFELPNNIDIMKEQAMRNFELFDDRFHS